MGSAVSRYWRRASPKASIGLLGRRQRSSGVHVYGSVELLLEVKHHGMVYLRQAAAAPPVAGDLRPHRGQDPPVGAQKAYLPHHPAILHLLIDGVTPEGAYSLLQQLGYVELHPECPLAWLPC